MKKVCFLIAALLSGSSHVEKETRAMVGVWLRPDSVVAYYVREAPEGYKGLAPDGEWYAVAGEPDYLIEAKVKRID